MELMETEWKRIKNLAHLWITGVPALVAIVLILLGAKNFYDIFSQAYGFYLLILGLLIIPIIFSLFILKEKPEED